MFGMGLGEILLVAVIAIVFLGPEKLPKAMVDIAKFFKSFKSSVNDAKNSFEQEMKLQELKDEATKYQEQLEQTRNDIAKEVSFDELDEIKKSTQEIADGINDVKNSVQKVTKNDKTADEKDA